MSDPTTPHRKKYLYDGEIVVCANCLNSEGNYIAWSQTWHGAVDPDLMVDSRVHYLVRGRGLAHRQWWVTTQRDGETCAGTSLDTWLKYADPVDPDPAEAERAQNLRDLMADMDRRSKDAE